MNSILLALALVTGTPDGSLIVSGNEFPAPAPVIVAQDQVKPGRLVSVKVGDPGQLPDKLYSITYTWFVNPAIPDLQVDRLDGTIAFFGSGEEGDNFNVTLVATYVYPDWEKKTVITKHAVAEKLIITRRDVVKPKPVDPTPDPVPTPTPPPGPAKPTFPAGVFGLSQLTYDTVLTVPLPEAKRNDEAQKLAKNYRDVVAAITSTVRAGGTMTAQQVISMTVDANIATLGTDAASWTPALNTIAQSANSQKSKFKTLADWQAAWLEIAIALEAFKT